MTSKASPFLQLPFEVRQAVYEQLLANLVVHPCPDEHQLNHKRAATNPGIQPATRPDYSPCGRTPGNFQDDLMECSGKHYQNLMSPGKWSNVCSPACPFKASDILHLMLACKEIYFELEPLFWSTITIAIGLPSLGIFFDCYLSTPLRSRAPDVVPRAQSVPRLILALPQIDELASQMGRGLKGYTRYAVDIRIKERLEQSLKYLTKSCPNVRSVEVIMEASQFEFSRGNDDDHILVYVRYEVETLLRLQGLEDFEVTYSGAFSPSYHQTAFADRRLKSCELALREMVTGKGEPVDAEQDRTGWVGDHSKSDYEDLRLWEFCERAIRHYNTTWKAADINQA